MAGTGAGLFGGGEERGGELFVEGEEVFDALTVVVEGLRTIAEFDGAVEFGVGFDERGRHGKRIVEVGESGIREFFAGVEDGLRGLFDGTALLGRGFRPRKIVVI